MTKPTPRSDLVDAVSEAWAITADAIPIDPDHTEQYQREAITMRAAALPVILRELLDVEVSPLWPACPTSSARQRKPWTTGRSRS
jgi:hypothetical protein